jgi:hypothetical protein
MLCWEQPELEARYDVWIAAKKRKSDFLCAILSSLLLLAYTACIYRGGCKHTVAMPAVGFVILPYWMWVLVSNPAAYAGVRNQVFASL